MITLLIAWLTSPADWLYGRTPARFLLSAAGGLGLGWLALVVVWGCLGGGAP